jgi:hypothetical protein
MNNNIEKDFFSNEKELRIMYSQIDIEDQSKFNNISEIDETGFSRDSSLYQSLNNSLEYNKIKNKIFTNKELREIENQQNLMENRYNNKKARSINNNPSAKDLIRNKNLNSKNSLAPSFNEKRVLNSKLNQNNLTIGNKVIIKFYTEVSIYKS